MPKSYSQGQLDGLCGVYSLVNAVAYVNRSSDRQCRRLFAHLYEIAVGVQPLVATHGLTFAQLAPVVAGANLYLRPRRQIRHSRPFRYVRFAAAASYFDALGARLADPRACALLSCGKGWNHWTIAERVTPTYVHLRDSSHPRYLTAQRDEFDLRSGDGVIRIHPRQTVIFEPAK